MPRGRRRLDTPVEQANDAAGSLADETPPVGDDEQVVRTDPPPAMSKAAPAAASVSEAHRRQALPADDVRLEQLPIVSEGPPPPMEAAVLDVDRSGGGDVTAGQDVPPWEVIAPTLDRRHGEAIDLERDLSAMATLCSRLARAVQPHDVAPVLEDAAVILRAVGVILWMWDPRTRTLGHVLAHGYPAEVLARLPRVECGADNAIADAFRSGESRVVRGSALATGAVVVPLVTAAGCVGALALELQDRNEEREPVRALATILAAQLAAVVHVPPMIEVATA
jgi:hypothetical protein